MTGAISIDLIVCTYNNAALLDRTLAAMARQRVSADVRWQVLVVDNNCTDETPAVVEKHRQAGGFPARRTTREYLQRITFGLGASRHHVRALTWKGSYPAWLAYSVVYAVGFGGFALLEALREREAALAFSPVAGWWTAMWNMLRMESRERRALLGCASAPRTP